MVWQGTAMVLPPRLYARHLQISLILRSDGAGPSPAVCHGLGGKGESVMTSLNLLTVRPIDLTQLSQTWS